MSSSELRQSARGEVGTNREVVPAEGLLDEAGVAERLGPEAVRRLEIQQTRGAGETG